jgi:acyl carrier protein
VLLERLQCLFLKGKKRMTKNDMIRELSEMLEIDSKVLVDDADLSEIGWDSLANLAFMSFADSNFNVVIAPKDLSSAKSISDILNLVSSHLEN